MHFALLRRFHERNDLSRPFTNNFIFQKTGLYEVKWLGYDSSENTWEPKSSFGGHCQKKLLEFYHKRMEEWRSAPEHE